MLCSVAQTAPRLGEPDRNLAACLDRLEEAAALGCKLVVLPECAVSGYMLVDEQEATRAAEPVPGPTVEAIEQACARLDLHCVAGLLERDGTRLRNTALLVGPGGLVGRYRKTHLPYLGVDRFVESGDEAPPVFDTPLGRIGIQICYELRFPEVTRSLALRGAEIVAHPTNWPTAVRPFADYLTRARAAENRVFLLTSNRLGRERGIEFLGRSQIVDPQGDCLVDAGEAEERVAVAEIDPGEAREKDRVIIPGEYEVSLFGDRRPELYGALGEHQDPVHAR